MVLNCWRRQLALMATLLSYVLLALAVTPWHSAYGGLALNLESVGVFHKVNCVAWSFV